MISIPPDSSSKWTRQLLRADLLARLTLDALAEKLIDEEEFEGARLLAYVELYLSESCQGAPGVPGSAMTNLQAFALSHPLARASGEVQPFRLLDLPWSIILTVNK